MCDIAGGKRFLISAHPGEVLCGTITSDGIRPASETCGPKELGNANDQQFQRWQRK